MLDLNLTGTQAIETERLIFRRFISEDLDSIYCNWTSDGEVTRYLSWNVHESVDVTRQVLESWLEEYQNTSNYHWAIVLKDIDQPIGSISLLNFSAQHCKAEAGYCIGSRWWGQGIMTEALKAVIAYAFRVLGLNRLETCHDVLNAASGKVMQKAGMRLEGRFRQWKYKKGRFVDYDHYAILREEYTQ